MKINETLHYIGENDFTNKLFENLYPVESMSYNSYLIKDNKNILLDTVDKSVSTKFINNLVSLLGSDNLDYIIVNHTEPDHAFTLKQVLEIYPNTTLVVNKATKNFLVNLFNISDYNFLVVDESSVIKTDNYELVFYLAPFVHWPEVMVTYCKVNKYLFSADAFGTFGAFDNLYDELDINEYRRYYTNICGKYGKQVNNLINKLNIEIKEIMPLHGPLLKNNISLLLEKYTKWANYESEDDNIVICYSSIYENTLNVCLKIKKELELNNKKVSIYDVSSTHFSYLISDIFKSKNIILASITYNSDLFPYMSLLVHEMISHNVSNKNLFLIENGAWAPMSNKIISSKFEDTSNNIVSKLTIKGSLVDDIKFTEFINTFKGV